MSYYTATWAMGYENATGFEEVIRRTLADLDDVVNRWEGATMFKIDERDPNDHDIVYKTSYVDIAMFRELLSRPMDE